VLHQAEKFDWESLVEFDDENAQQVVRHSYRGKACASRVCVFRLSGPRAGTKKGVSVPRAMAADGERCGSSSATVMVRGGGSPRVRLVVAIALSRSRAQNFIFPFLSFFPLVFFSRFSSSPLSFLRSSYFSLSFIILGDVTVSSGKRKMAAMAGHIYI
jgi:hypothetical protein